MLSPLRNQFAVLDAAVTVAAPSFKGVGRRCRESVELVESTASREETGERTGQLRMYRVPYRQEVSGKSIRDIIIMIADWPYSQSIPSNPLLFHLFIFIWIFIGLDISISILIFSSWPFLSRHPIRWNSSWHFIFYPPSRIPVGLSLIAIALALVVHLNIFSFLMDAVVTP